MANFKKYREVELLEETSGTWVTYIGTARIPSGMTLTIAKTKPIWKIIKYVKTGTTTVLTDMFLPLDSAAWYSQDMIFVWNDRASLTWDA